MKMRIVLSVATCLAVSLAAPFLEEALSGPQPWCCFVSTQEPHDPFIAGREAFESYDLDALPAPPNWHDDLSDKPNIYRKQSAIWDDRTDRERREAAACYFATITEIDQQFGRLLDMVEQAGQSDNTLVVLTSDHGELLGAHGLYCKNFSAFEEIYHIPLVLAGPGLARGAVSKARVGLHDLCPTLLELSGIGVDVSFQVPDCRSFASAARDPARADVDYATGFAEYFGGRYMITQRIAWNGPWKYVHNGFDFDELYNLDTDPFEMHNLAGSPDCTCRVRDMMTLIWRTIRNTNDHSLLNTDYPIIRAAPVGPGVLDEVDE